MKALQKYLSKQLTDYFIKRIPYTSYESVDKENLFKGSGDEVFNHTFLLCLLCISLALGMSLTIYLNQEFINYLLIIESSLSKLLAGIIFLVVSMCSPGLILFKTVERRLPLMQYLHNKIPYKSERENSVLEAALEAQGHYDLVDINPLGLYHEFISIGAKEFNLKYFNKTSAGLIDFMNQRVSIDSLFLNYALSIPRRSEFSVESLRKILMCYTGSFYLDKPLKLETVFSKYSLSEIETIFTMPGDRNVLEDLDPEESIEVVNSFDKLLAKEIPENFNIFDKTQIQGFSFEILKTPSQYIHTGGEFNNCITSRFEIDSIIVIARKENSKTAMEFKNNELTQMAGVGKKVSDYRDELTNILKKNGFKIKCNRPHTQD